MKRCKGGESVFAVFCYCAPHDVSVEPGAIDGLDGVKSSIAGVVRDIRRGSGRAASLVAAGENVTPVDFDLGNTTILSKVSR